MSLVELILLGIGLAMDAFAVSVCKGLSTGKISLKHLLLCGIWFGGFQALMPLIGYLLGSLFSSAIESFDHWIAFGLLALIGANMIREALSQGDEDSSGDDFSAPAMLVLAVATSIDALAVGVSLSMAGGVNIYLAVFIISLVTFVMSAAGVKIGSVFGNKFEQKAQITGGVILILLGVKILFDHLLG